MTSNTTILTNLNLLSNKRHVSVLGFGFGNESLTKREIVVLDTTTSNEIKGSIIKSKLKLKLNSNGIFAS